MDMRRLSFLCVGGVDFVSWGCLLYEQGGVDFVSWLLFIV